MKCLATIFLILVFAISSVSHAGEKKVSQDLLDPVLTRWQEELKQSAEQNPSNMFLQRLSRNFQFIMESYLDPLESKHRDKIAKPLQNMNVITFLSTPIDQHLDLIESELGPAGLIFKKYRNDIRLNVLKEVSNNYFPLSLYSHDPNREYGILKGWASVLGLQNARDITETKILSLRKIPGRTREEIDYHMGFLKLLENELLTQRRYDQPNRSP